jgi:RNA polymerase sigma factor (TIGR02999 family)
LRITGPLPDVTGLLLAWRGGDEEALSRLVPAIERELHRIAERCMAGERAGHSLQATALVNEAYLRLINVQKMDWQNRAHFLAMAARLMRRILVDSARARRNLKRGGVKITLDEELLVTGDRPPDLVALDDALQALEKIDARRSQGHRAALFRRPHRGRDGDCAPGGSRYGDARLAIGEGMAGARAVGRDTT